MTKSDELIKMWSTAVEREQGPYFVAQDKTDAPKLFEGAITESAEGWRQHESYFSMRDAHQAKLHLNLIPEPYAGDIRRAPVVVLLKNPGFSDHCYWEHTQGDYRRAMFANIRQEFPADRSPFFSFWPEFSHMGNYRYLRGLFGPAVRSMVGKNGEGRSTQQVIDALGRTICVVQMTGYTSAASPDCSKLASAELARAWLREEVLPRVGAASQGRSLLVMRAVKEWFEGSKQEWSKLVQAQKSKPEHERDFFDEPKRRPSFAPGTIPGEILRRRLADELKVKYVPVSPKVAQSGADDGDG